ncbi:MAG: AmmeMemoRadiSam system radical SAM enzyme [Candidatus Nanoarchaeia archaeon]
MADKKAELFVKLDKNLIRCKACENNCVIPLNKTGICGVRANFNGKGKILVNNQVAAIALDPIEKKPLFHFLPGSRILSFGTVGCNMRCAFCQNWEISQASKNLSSSKETEKIIKEMSEAINPKDIVNLAIKENVQSLAATYNEPTVFFEFAYEVFKLAKKKGLKTVFVSNGYQSIESIEYLDGVLDGINIDLKSMSNNFYEKYCGAKLKPVLRNIKEFYNRDIWIELTTLIIPNLNDSAKEIKKAAEFIKSISLDIPWHITAFHPAYKMLDKPKTPINTLFNCWETAKKVGLNYIYLGNVFAPEKESTYCPNCNSLLINRSGYLVENKALIKGKCNFCKAKIPGIWDKKNF